MNITGRVKVFKDEGGKYFTFIKGNYLDDAGLNQSFFIRKKILIPKDKSLKNKSLIEIKNGWVSEYRFKTEEGEIVYGESYYIKEWEMINEGTDVNFKRKEYHRKEENKPEQEEKDFSIAPDDIVVPI